MVVEHRVAVAVITRTDRVLMCHRRADRSWYPDVWDFPGGHIEDGETALSAVRRESREELGIAIEEPLVELDRWTSTEEEITFVHVQRWDGSPRHLAPGEHDQIRWFTLAEALDLKLPEARYPDLLRRVLLPE